MNTIAGYSSSYRARAGRGEYLLRLLGGRAFLLWVLLLCLVAALGNGLLESTTGLQTIFIYPLLVIAATLGWFLAALPFRGGFSMFLGMFVGIEYLLISIGSLGDNIGRIVGAFFTYIRDLLNWYNTGILPDASAFINLLGEFWQDIAVLVVRAFRWLTSININSASYDPVGTVLVWGIGLWFCALWAGWATRRKSDPVLAILPGGIVLGFALSFTGSNPYSLLPVLGLTLVMSAMLQHLAREKSWNSQNIDYSQGLWGEIVTSAAGIAVGLVLLAAISPSITYEKIADWVDDVTNRNNSSSEVVAQSFGLDQKPVPKALKAVELAASTSLPRRHLIGSGPELSRIVVMTISTGEFPATPDAMLFENDVHRYYWRSLTYDRYFSRGWSTSYTEVTNYDAGELFSEPDVPHTRVLRQSVTMIGESVAGLVHVTGQLIALDEDYEVSVRWPDEMFAATTESKEYRADSLIPDYTEEELRGATMNYPVWILERYLQLPETVPERVIVLARDLTATEPTAFDRALAIESYLRTFPYTLDVPTPTLQQDIADYFLFELKEGYCDYYATSMVVLARAAGLPARMVVGYITGTYDPLNARYIVTEADAHAWVEIYFPGYGWIEFEPTGGYPGIIRGSELEPIQWPEGYEPAPLVEPADPEVQRLLAFQWLLISVGAIVLSGLLATLADAIFLALLPQRRMLSTIRRRLLRYNNRLLLHLSSSSTPDEIAVAYATRIRDMAMEMDTLDTWFNKGADIIKNLSSVYTTVWYTNREALSQHEQRQIARQWWALRWRLWAAIWIYRRRRERPQMPTQRVRVPRSHIHPDRPAV